jgi:hypothetical protein
VGLANLGSESESCVGSCVHLVGVSISFEKNFYRLPFTPPLSGSSYRSFMKPTFTLPPSIRQFPLLIPPPLDLQSRPHAIDGHGSRAAAPLPLPYLSTVRASAALPLTTTELPRPLALAHALPLIEAPAAAPLLPPEPSHRR